MFLGYQIPDFEYGTSPQDTFGLVVAQAHEAESAGFDCLYVMDHFYPLPLIGPIDGTMFESQTLLSALAATTSNIGLSPLVSSVTYRNPTLLAKSTATIDAISGGRGGFGLGTGWFEREHRDFGFDLGRLSDRYEKLSETLQILRALISGDPGVFSGRWFRCDRPIMNPPLRSDIPVLVGGGGELRTFGLAARYADHLNILCDAAVITRKVSAAEARCAEVDRDPATLLTSYTAYLFTADSDREAQVVHEAFMARRGGVAAAAVGRHFVGTAATVADQLLGRIVDKGVGGLIVNMVTAGHVPGRISDVAHALRAAR
ncbi:MAG: TIGR03560 family F420-dependent LLM class oxidoreductase [Rhodococcus sp. (in: high G+C Gram-positive bacteria)]|uniref:TIGR03560 family F420-dependent LLM class oxidoreductase n=1 Tax=Rhodococcus sp. SBT000017 TaxID=1803385 RepID=UPI001605396B|nr:TIGR03560 family F420-dependent LLM class oxidoreductase [Rhodococcus sp. SBT000017]